MNDHYRLYRRSNGIYYIEHAKTRRQQSLRTKCPDQANTLLLAYNRALEEPALNMALAKAYFSGRAPQLITRTWNDVLEEMAARYQGSTRTRFQKFARSRPILLIKDVRLTETESAHFLAVLNHSKAGVSTNKWLRIVHNRALDLNWLPMPVMARKAWPSSRAKRVQAIARKQHEKLIETEQDPGFRHYLEMLWETGGSQTDTAELRRDNIDEERHCLTYSRKKMRNQNEQEGAAITIGNSLKELLAKLPKEGLLFPKLAQQRENVRASRFRKLCDRLGFTNISLHSYRYAWAERAKTASMPLREAMAHLGHGSKAVHHAYSASAEIITFPLEYYEEIKRRKDEELRKQMNGLNSPIHEVSALKEDIEYSSHASDTKRRKRKLDCEFAVRLAI